MSPQLEQLPLADLKHAATVRAAGIDQSVVNEYAERVDDLPPVVVFRDPDGALWLADGAHRQAAHIKAGRTEIMAHVYVGSRRDAILFAVGSNAKHGLRRSNADKRQAVGLLLDDPEWAQWSDAVIADRCGVSDRFVAKLRAERQPATPHGSESGIRIGADGRLIDTSKIGTRKPRQMPDESAEAFEQRKPDVGQAPAAPEPEPKPESSTDVPAPAEPQPEPAAEQAATPDQAEAEHAATSEAQPASEPAALNQGRRQSLWHTVQRDPERYAQLKAQKTVSDAELEAAATRAEQRSLIESLDNAITELEAWIDDGYQLREVANADQLPELVDRLRKLADDLAQHAARLAPTAEAAE